MREPSSLVPFQSGGQSCLVLSVTTFLPGVALFMYAPCPSQDVFKTDDDKDRGQKRREALLGAEWRRDRPLLPTGHGAGMCTYPTHRSLSGWHALQTASPSGISAQRPQQIYGKVSLRMWVSHSSHSMGTRAEVSRKIVRLLLQCKTASEGSRQTEVTSKVKRA